MRNALIIFGALLLSAIAISWAMRPAVNSPEIPDSSPEVKPEPKPVEPTEPVVTPPEPVEQPSLPAQPASNSCSGGDCQPRSYQAAPRRRWRLFNRR